MANAGLRLSLEKLEYRYDGSKKLVNYFDRLIQEKKAAVPSHQTAERLSKRQTTSKKERKKRGNERIIFNLGTR